MLAAPKHMRRPLAAALVGGAITIALVVAVGHGDVDRMTYGDGLFYQYVASHMDVQSSDLNPTVAARGPAFRYGRIGLPAAIWLLSAGNPRAMPYIQPLIMVLAGAAIAAMATELVPAIGLGAAVLPFLALGLSLSLSGGYAEPVAAAFAMGACLLALRRRWSLAALALSITMLTRETAAVFLIGLGLWALFRRELRGSLILSLSVIPVVAWHLAVAARFGHLPLADPYLKTHEVGLSAIPFSAFAKAFVDFPIGVAATASLHLIFACVAVACVRRSALGAIAAATAAQIVFLPLLTWHYLGDAFRTFSFLELMTILAVAAWWKADGAVPAQMQT
jgi:hypothetical protein